MKTTLALLFLALILQSACPKAYGQAYRIAYQQILKDNDMPDTTDAVLTIDPEKQIAIYEYGKILASAVRSPDVDQHGKLILKVPKKIDTLGSLIRTDLRTGNMQVREKLYGKYYYINDSSSIRWSPQLIDTLLGSMPLKKTTCTFRGRRYEVSYLPHTILRAGPWKFRGLPGLIVEAADADREVVFKLIAIQEIPTPQHTSDGLHLADITSFESYEAFRQYRNKLRQEDMALLLNSKEPNTSKKIIHYSTVKVFYLEKDGD